MTSTTSETPSRPDPHRVLVTGAAGFVGRHLTTAVRRTWPDVTIVSADLVEAETCDQSLICDLLGEGAAETLLREARPDLVFHLAGLLGPRDLETLVRANVLATQALLEALVATGSSAAVVAAGSAAEYGTVARERLPVVEDEACWPVSPYGLTKAWQTQLEVMYATRGVDAVVGRMFNLIGPRISEDLFSGWVASRLRSMSPGGGEIPVGDLSAKRDMLDVADAVEGLIALARRGRTGRVYNVCSGRSVPMREVFDALVRASGLDIRPREVSSRVRAADVSDIYGSAERIAADTGWRVTTSLAESAGRMFEQP